MCFIVVEIINTSVEMLKYVCMIYIYELSLSRYAVVLRTVSLIVFVLVNYLNF